MSVMGQERTLTALDFMSAFGGKADEIVAKADIEAFDAINAMNFSVRPPNGGWFCKQNCKRTVRDTPELGGLDGIWTIKYCPNSGLPKTMQHQTTH